MRKLGKIMALNVERDFVSEEQVSKMRKMYQRTPVKAIKGILAITNPVKLLQGILNIYLVRPLGVKNLLQKQTATAIELKRSEALLSKAKQHATNLLKRHCDTKKIFTRVEQYLQSNALPAPDHENYVENEKGFREVSYETLYTIELVKEILKDVIDVTTLTIQDLTAIQQVLIHSIRVQQKRDLVGIFNFAFFCGPPLIQSELLGTDQVASIIKELWSIFDAPIGILCATALGSHLERMFKKAKAIVKISETSNKAVDQIAIDKRVEAYDAVLQQFQEDVYLLIHEVAKHDNGVFKQTFQWYINIIKCTQNETLDIQSLLTSLSPEELAKIMEEVDACIKYQELVKQGEKHPQRPPEDAIQTLVPAFSEMVRSRLPNKKQVRAAGSAQ